MSKTAIASLLILASMILGYFFAYDAWNRRNALAEEQAHFEAVLVEFEAVTTTFEKLSNTYDSFPQEKLDRANGAIPNRTGVRDIPATLEYLAAANSITLKNIGLASPTDKKTADSKAARAGVTPASNTAAAPSLQPGVPRPAGSAAPTTTGTPNGTNDLPIDLTLGGSYEAFKAFLDALQKNIPIFDVESITFGGTDQATGQFTFTIKMKAYYQ